MRLFVGVEVGDAIAAGAVAAIRELESRAKKLAPEARLTWIPADRLHLTVRFIGAVDDARAAVIDGQLKPAIAVAPFRVTVQGIGTFPARGAPRVVWAGIAEGGESLAAVERVVTARLARIGIPPEERAYSAHLTLARVREPARLRSPALLEGFFDMPIGSTSVEAITLFESRLSPKGPTYVALHRTALVA